MTFLNPLVLFGLAAAAIPVILHLLNLRKLRVIEFSTLTFLKELQQSKIRRLKLRQLLLLLLRTLLIISIIFAFARPALRGTMLGNFGSHANSTVVYILDDSFSESASDEHGERFKQAKDATKKLIDLLKEGDEAFLIKLSDLPKGTIDPATHDFNALARAVYETKVSMVRHPLDEAFSLASRLLMQSHNVNKEVYLISDLQRTLFAYHPGVQINPSSFGPQTNVFVVSLGSKNISNVAVDSVDVVTKILEQEKPVTIKSWVRNFGDLPLRDYVVSIYSGSVEFSVIPKRTGNIRGYVELEADNLEADNRRYFSLHIPEQINIGLVAQSATDAQFVRLALRAGNSDSGKSVVNISQTTPEKFPFLDLKKVDVLCCINVPSFNTREADRIREFVAQGGGLIIFPGDNAQIHEYNTGLLSSLQIPPIQALSQNPDSTSRISFRDIDIDHPIFSTMFEKEIRRGISSREVVESPSIAKSIRRTSGRQGRTIISLSDGTPFLSEHSLGQGRILFYSVAPTLIWSDFPLKPVFAPLVFRSIVYSMSHGEDPQSFIAGEEVGLKIDRDISNKDNQFKITAPDSVEEVIRSVPSSAKQAAASISFEPKRFTLPGHYVLRNGTTEISVISINTDQRESDLRKVNDDELAALWKSAGIPPTSVKFIENNSEIEKDILQSRFGVELWKYCIMAALLFALLEMLVARDGSKAMAQPA